MIGSPPRLRSEKPIVGHPAKPGFSWTAFGTGNGLFLIAPFEIDIPQLELELGVVWRERDRSAQEFQTPCQVAVWKAYRPGNSVARLVSDAVR